MEIRVYHSVSRTKSRYKIATLYNIQTIYRSKKNTGKRRNLKYIQMPDHVTGVSNKAMLTIIWYFLKDLL